MVTDASVSGIGKLCREQPAGHGHPGGDTNTVHAAEADTTSLLPEFGGCGLLLAHSDSAASNKTFPTSQDHGQDGGVASPVGVAADAVLAKHEPGSKNEVVQDGPAQLQSGTLVHVEALRAEGTSTVYAKEREGDFLDAPSTRLYRHEHRVLHQQYIQFEENSEGDWHSSDEDAADADVSGFNIETSSFEDLEWDMDMLFPELKEIREMPTAMQDRWEADQTVAAAQHSPLPDVIAETKREQATAVETPDWPDGGPARMSGPVPFGYTSHTEQVQNEPEPHISRISRMYVADEDDDDSLSVISERTEPDDSMEEMQRKNSRQMYPELLSSSSSSTMFDEEQYDVQTSRLLSKQKTASPSWLSGKTSSASGKRLVRPQLSAADAARQGDAGSKSLHTQVVQVPAADEEKGREPGMEDTPNTRFHQTTSKGSNGVAASPSEAAMVSSERQPVVVITKKYDTHTQKHSETTAGIHTETADGCDRVEECSAHFLMVSESRPGKQLDKDKDIHVKSSAEVNSRKREESKGDNLVARSIARVFQSPRRAEERKHPTQTRAVVSPEKVEKRQTEGPLEKVVSPEEMAKVQQTRAPAEKVACLEQVDPKAAGVPEHVLLRRDTITQMAMEAQLQGGPGTEDEFANIFEKNKQFVTDMEWMEVMQEGTTKKPGESMGTEPPVQTAVGAVTATGAMEKTKPSFKTELPVKVKLPPQAPDCTKTKKSPAASKKSPSSSKKSPEFPKSNQAARAAKPSKEATKKRRKSADKGVVSAAGTAAKEKSSSKSFSSSETLVDDSHVASVTELQKLFNKPPSYMMPGRQQSPAEPDKITSCQGNDSLSDGSIKSPSRKEVMPYKEILVESDYLLFTQTIPCVKVEMSEQMEIEVLMSASTVHHTAESDPALPVGTEAVKGDSSHSDSDDAESSIAMAAAVSIVMATDNIDGAHRPQKSAEVQLRATGSLATKSTGENAHISPTPHDSHIQKCVEQGDDNDDSMVIFNPESMETNTNNNTKSLVSSTMTSTDSRNGVMTGDVLKEDEDLFRKEILDEEAKAPHLDPRPLSWHSSDSREFQTFTPGHVVAPAMQMEVPTHDNDGLSQSSSETDVVATNSSFPSHEHEILSPGSEGTCTPGIQQTISSHGVSEQGEESRGKAGVIPTDIAEGGDESLVRQGGKGTQDANAHRECYVYLDASTPSIEMPNFLYPSHDHEVLLDGTTDEASDADADSLWLHVETRQAHILTKEDSRARVRDWLGLQSDLSGLENGAMHASAHDAGAETDSSDSGLLYQAAAHIIANDEDGLPDSTTASHVSPPISHSLLGDERSPWVSGDHLSSASRGSDHCQSPGWEVDEDGCLRGIPYRPSEFLQTTDLDASSVDSSSMNLQCEIFRTLAARSQPLCSSSPLPLDAHQMVTRPLHSSQNVCGSAVLVDKCSDSATEQAQPEKMEADSHLDIDSGAITRYTQDSGHTPHDRLDRVESLRTGERLHGEDNANPAQVMVHPSACPNVDILGASGTPPANPSCSSASSPLAYSITTATTTNRPSAPPPLSSAARMPASHSQGNSVYPW